MIRPTSWEADRLAWDPQTSPTRIQSKRVRMGWEHRQAQGRAGVYETYMHADQTYDIGWPNQVRPVESR